MLSTGDYGTTIVMVEHQVFGRLPSPTVVEDEPGPVAELGLLGNFPVANVPAQFGLLLPLLTLPAWLLLRQTRLLL